MMQGNAERSSEEQKTWHPAQPEELPALTFWPIVLAAGTVFFFWGMITSLIISGVGLASMLIALWGWIEEFSDER
jgi:hypothetical protein